MAAIAITTPFKTPRPIGPHRDDREDELDAADAPYLPKSRRVDEADCRRCKDRAQSRDWHDAERWPEKEHRQDKRQRLATTLVSCERPPTVKLTAVRESGCGNGECTKEPGGRICCTEACKFGILSRPYGQPMAPKLRAATIPEPKLTRKIAAAPKATVMIGRFVIERKAKGGSIAGIPSPTTPQRRGLQDRKSTIWRPPGRHDQHRTGDLESGDADDLKQPEHRRGKLGSDSHWIDWVLRASSISGPIMTIGLNVDSGKTLDLAE